MFPIDNQNAGSNFPADFYGNWKMEKECASNADICYEFSLFVKQQGTEIRGSLCSSNGYKVDGGCSENSDDFQGTINGNIATVKFKTTYAQLEGEAALSLTKTGLDWKIIRIDQGESYVYDQAHLFKVNSQPIKITD
ncbi:MAG: hypothetical protein Q8R34_01405 [bacterium]|nr:hypothetical protein [bacterium]